MASLLASAARRQAVSFRCVGRRVGQATVAVRSSPAARPAMWAQSRAFAVSAAQIKELRNLTMAPISDCKKALNAEDVDGDLSKAVDWLRKNGVATASKKAGRSAAEGVVSVAAAQPPSRSAVVVEVNSETDFVGRNTDFMAFVEKVAGAALDATSAAAASDANMASLSSAQLPGGDSTGAACTVEQGVTDMVAKFRENLVLRRVARLDVSNGVVASYVHNSLAPGLGKIASVVALESDTALEGEAAETAHSLGRTIAMHIVAANPAALSRDTVDTEALQREIDILSEQARMSGKPDNIIQKMVDGRLGKFFKESCLLEQPCVVGDDDRAVGKVVDSVAKSLGVKLEVTNFVRMQCGEGVEVTPEE